MYIGHLWWLTINIISESVETASLALLYCLSTPAILVLKVDSDAASALADKRLLAGVSVI